VYGHAAGIEVVNGKNVLLTGADEVASDVAPSVVSRPAGRLTPSPVSGGGGLGISPGDTTGVIVPLGSAGHVVSSPVSGQGYGTSFYNVRGAQRPQIIVAEVPDVGVDWRFSYLGTPRASVDGIRLGFWDALYTKLLSVALSKGASFLETDLSANVLVGYFNIWTRVAMKIRHLTTFLGAESSPIPALAEVGRLARRHRSRILGQLANLSGLPIPGPFREVVDRYATLTCNDMEGPYFLTEVYSVAGGITLLTSSVWETYMTEIDTDLGTLRTTANHPNIIQLLRFLFGLQMVWPLNPPKIDAGVVTEYLTMAVCHDSTGAGTVNKQEPNLADNANVEVWCSECQYPRGFASLIGFTKAYESRKNATNAVGYGLLHPRKSAAVQSSTFRYYSQGAGLGVQTDIMDADVDPTNALMELSPLSLFLYWRRVAEDVDAVGLYGSHIVIGAHPVDVPFESMIHESRSWLEKVLMPSSGK
jgi:hypothetical protein